MMPSNGPPTPGGSNASPGVKRERGEVWDENTYRRVPFLGWKGGHNVSPLGGRRLPPQGDEGASSGIGRMTRSLPLLNEGGKIISRLKEGYMSPPPPGRAEERTEEGKWKVSRTYQKNRHDEPTRAGNYAC